MKTASDAQWLAAWRFAGRWALLIGITAALGAVSSLASDFQQPTGYSATALLYIAPTQNGSLQSDQLSAAELIARTYAGLMLTPQILQPAIKSSGLDLTPDQAASRVVARPQTGTQLLAVVAQGRTASDAVSLADAFANSLADQIRSDVAERLRAQEQQVQGELDQVNRLREEQSQQLGQISAVPAGLDSDNARAQAQAQLTATAQRSASINQTLQDLRDAEAGAPGLVRLAAPAARSVTPTRPPPLLVALEGAAVGLLTAIGVALIVDRMDDRLLSAERLQRATDLAVVGRLPVFASADQVLLVSQVGRQTAAAITGVPGQFRVLWASLVLLMAGQKAARSVLITSSRAEEGRSTTAANLAVAAAQAGNLVVLVDANLRRPMLHALFGVANSKGLTSLIMDERLPVSDVLVETAVDGLWLLPSGPLPDDPGTCLSSPSLRARMEDLSARASVILIDSPPVLGASDSAVLAALADGTLLIVDGQTPIPQVLQSLQSLRKSGALILGAVLNRAVRSEVRSPRTGFAPLMSMHDRLRTYVP